MGRASELLLPVALNWENPLLPPPMFQQADSISNVGRVPAAPGLGFWAPSTLTVGWWACCQNPCSGRLAQDVGRHRPRVRQQGPP